LKVTSEKGSRRTPKGTKKHEELFINKQEALTLFDADKNIVSITEDGFKIQKIKSNGDVYEYKFVIEGLKVLQFVKSKQNVKFKQIDSLDLPVESREIKPENKNETSFVKTGN